MTDLLQQRGPGRPCGICQSQRRSAIEAAITGGGTISAVGAEFGFHRSTIRTHGQKHMLWSMEQLKDAGLEPVGLLVRLADIADRLREAGLEAEEAGRHADHVRAADGERRAVTALLSHGLSHEQQLAEMEGQATRLKAVTRAVRQSPELAARVADELDAMDERASAGQLRALIFETKEIHP